MAGQEQVPSASREPGAVRATLNIKADEIQVAGVLEHAIGCPPVPTLICVALNRKMRGEFWLLYLQWVKII